MIAKSFVILVTNIILLKYTSLEIMAVLIGGIAGHIAFFICTAKLLFGNLMINFVKSEVKGLLQFGLPLAFLSLGTVLLGFGDRYVLGLVKDLGEVGIYTLAYKVASVVSLFILQAVGLAVMPVALRSFSSEEGRLLLRKIFTYLSIVLCLMFLIISVFSLDILKIFVKREEYLLADIIVPVLLFAYIFDGLKSLYSYHLLYVKRTVWIMGIILSSAVFNIILNLLIIPKYSYMGAAVTTLIT
jgi:O-antigen/teichoic acid export membrane protein